LIPFLITLLVCQLIGEVAVITFVLPLPGPVVGMAVLFLWLAVAGTTTGNFEVLSNQLLSHLSLLFVPAGVGVMLHAELLGEELVPIAIALVVSTLLTLALTAWIMNKLGAEPRDS
jgi:holin-like protein